MAGNLIIISAPSGTGKTALVAELLRRNPDLTLSVSHTTRTMRSIEREGEHYFFTTRDAFRAMAETGEFLEWAEYKGNLYGTRKTFVEDHLRNGDDVVLEIDVQGAIQVKRKMPEAVSVFLLPPSRAELEKRLRKRATETKETEDDIQNRLALARHELGCFPEYDHIVVNDNFEEAAAKLHSIVQCRRTTLARQSELIHSIIGSFGGLG